LNDLIGNEAQSLPLSQCLTMTGSLRQAQLLQVSFTTNSLYMPIKHYVGALLFLQQPQASTNLQTIMKVALEGFMTDSTNGVNHRHIKHSMNFLQKECPGNYDLKLFLSCRKLCYFFPSNQKHATLCVCQKQLHLFCF
jgi:hypothetical protein